MDTRFTALRVTGTVFRILAWIALILGVLSAIVLLVLSFVLAPTLNLFNLSQQSAPVGIALFVLIVIISMILFLFLYAAGEFLYLLLALEDNTRRTAYIVQQQFLTVQPVVPPPPAPEDAADPEALFREP